MITDELSIPTIGIGSGNVTDGQVLVINDLLGEGPKAPPSFCRPVKNFYQEKLDAIDAFINEANKQVTKNKGDQSEYENIYN